MFNFVFSVTDIYIFQVLTPERQKGCRNLLGDYFSSLCKHLCSDHKDLRVMEKQNRKTIMVIIFQFKIRASDKGEIHLRTGVQGKFL